MQGKSENKYPMGDILTLKIRRTLMVRRIFYVRPAWMQSNPFELYLMCSLRYLLISLQKLLYEEGYRIAEHKKELTTRLYLWR